jgi:SHS2 domain-containing protein
MPYQFLEDVATADIAFEAWGDTMEEMFAAAAAATMNVMVRDLDTIAARRNKSIQVESNAVDMLLFELLQELIFYKDAEQLLLRVSAVSIEPRDGRWTLQAEAHGEELDPDQHELIVDVKAVTLHRFCVQQTARGWEAMVILDI